MARGIEAIDSGYRSAFSVSSPAMQAIYEFGTQEQKDKHLTLMAQGKLTGCLGLTEPNHGSDPGSMETRARYDKDKKVYILKGSKTWITKSPISDIAIIWPKSSAHDNKIKGFIVDQSQLKDTTSFTTPKIDGKLSLRASITGSIFMDDNVIPQENILPNVSGLKGPFICTLWYRMGCHWSWRVLSPFHSYVCN